MPVPKGTLPHGTSNSSLHHHTRTAKKEHLLSLSFSLLSPLSSLLLSPLSFSLLSPSSVSSINLPRALSPRGLQRERERETRDCYVLLLLLLHRGAKNLEEDEYSKLSGVGLEVNERRGDWLRERRRKED